MVLQSYKDSIIEFAKKFNLEIIPVLEGGDVSKEAFTGDGFDPYYSIYEFANSIGLIKGN